MSASRLILYKGLTVLDGSFSSPLETEGVRIEGDPLWTARALITNPDKVVEVHKKYLAAGARIIETNSYHAAIPIFRRELGVDTDRAKEILRSSVQLGRRAIAEFCKETGRKTEEILLAGSIGPYAVIAHDGSEYSGKYIESTPSEIIVSYYQDQISTLLESGVDLLAFETIPSLAEAKLIIQVLKSLSTPVFSWISFVCRDGTFTCAGDRFADVVSSLCLVPQVNLIGINCTTPQNIASLLKQGTHGMKPFVIYPNSGESYAKETGWSGTADRQPFVQYIPEWASRGVKVIGGCCRVSPGDIKEIAEAVANLSNPVDLKSMNLTS